MLEGRESSDENLKNATKKRKSSVAQSKAKTWERLYSVNKK